MRGEPLGPRGRTIVALVALVAVTFAFVIIPAAVFSTGSLAAPDNVSNKSPYYANNTTAIDNTSWFAGRENATLDNSLNMLTRISTFVIGGSSGGVGAEGALITGLIVFGAVSGLTGTSRVGTVGGAVMGVAVIAALVEAGLAPFWTYGIVLFAVGAVATKVFIRVVR